MQRITILTTAVGYSEEQVRPLWHSLQRVGFSGRLVMLVDSATADQLEPRAPSFVQLLVLEKYSPDQLLHAALPQIQEMAHRMVLDSAEFMLACDALDRIWTNHFYASFNHASVYRYLFYRSYLVEHAADIDAVILCDSRDVLFQVNPAEVLTADTPLCFGVEHDSTTLGVEAFNSAWVQHLWGDDVLEKYRGKRICCSGATLGSLTAIQTYLDAFCPQLLTHAAQTKAGYGFDQAIHNRLWWDGALPGLIITENFHSDVINAQGEPDLTLDNQSASGLLCRVDNGAPIMLVHQYDRYAPLARQLLKTLGYGR